MTDIKALFTAWSNLASPPIVELLNSKQETVGALYLNKLNVENAIISETDNSEKYFFYLNGLAVYFSYFKKIGS